MSYKMSSQIFYVLFRSVKKYVLCPSLINIFNILVDILFLFFWYLIMNDVSLLFSILSYMFD